MEWPMEKFKNNTPFTLWEREYKYYYIKEASHEQKKVSNKKDVEPARGKGYPNCTAQKLQTDPCLIMKELKETFSYVTLVLQ